MPEQNGEKKHEASAHRRDEAKKKGNVAKSQDLSSALLLCGALTFLMVYGGSMLETLVSYMRTQFSSDVALSTTDKAVTNQSFFLSFLLAKTLVPLMAFVFMMAVVSNAFQTGLMFLPEKLSFDISRINPGKGIGRLFSLQNVVRLGFGIFKIIIVMTVAVLCLVSEQETIMILGSFDIGQLGAFISSITLWTCLKIGIALLILAIADYAFQKWKQEQDLRMTDEEVREEMKSQQGDPQILARRRAVQQELVKNRIGSSVPTADVVVTNPTELAIAIKYEMDEMSAPVVVAKGAGTLAQRIRRIALENDIPIVERKPLARTLYEDVDIGQEVPAQQYAAVAEVLKYVYDLQGREMPTTQDAA